MVRAAEFFTHANRLCKDFSLLLPVEHTNAAVRKVTSQPLQRALHFTVAQFTFYSNF